MDHDAVDRPENIWSRAGDPRTQQSYDWWIRVYYAESHRRKVGPRTHYRFFQDILGRQTTTVTFTHRNWVWARPDEGWVLYVDRRGPAFHVARRGMHADEAWAAFERFRERVEAWFRENPA